MTVGERIKAVREQRGLSVIELAERLGKARSTIYRYESDEIQDMPTTVLEPLAEALNTTPAYLMGWTEEQSNKNANARTELSPLASEGWIQLTDVYKRLPPEKQHLPDYELAATTATEALIRHQISAAPVSPLPILKAQPGVLVVSYMELAEMKGVSRENVVSLFDAENQDATTIVKKLEDHLLYLVSYNARAPIFVLQQSLARELGHIMIGHDGSRDAEVRAAEVECFANYLLFPRPLIRAVQDAGLPMTIRNFSLTTGCFSECMDSLAETPGIRISKQLNRILRGQFTTYVENCVRFQSLFNTSDNTSLADLGTFMDNYEE